ncbi:MAG TPA: response regulator [Candidatus Acidoferrales bacterium]|nr:response regulator [Candidatus Acidoferrales bacterium]
MFAHQEVLIATTDPGTRRGLASILSQWGLEPLCTSTVYEAKTFLARQSVPMVFCQDHLADGSFRDLLGAAKLVKSKARVVVTSRTEDMNGYLEAIRLHAFDVIPCPCRPADVHRVVSQALRDGGEKPAHEIKVFYDRWKASVFRFCCLFLGYRDLAGECTCEAFLNYLREKLVLQTSALPARLMGFALAAVKRRSVLAPETPSPSLAQKVRCIPSDERAVFIMRSVLGLDDSSVALATALPVERMRGLWLRSLLNLRAMLPRGFFEGEAPAC